MRTTRHVRFRWLGAIALIALSALTVTCGREPLGPESPESRVSFTETPAGPAILIGAGDIAGCDRPDDGYTADLVDSLLVEYPNATVATFGDNVYPDGTVQEYTDCYDPTWGRFKDRTWAALGNHEYNTPGATPSFDYFGPRLGPRDLAYYSLDVGSWHLIVLNTGDRSVVPVDAGSAQEQWLRNDLANTTQACVMAVIHDPLFYSCGSSPCSYGKTWVKPLWDALYQYDADIVVSGDRHHYERFALQDPEGNLDPVKGIRLFIVGTGGRGIGTPDEYPHPNVEVVNDEGVNGVMKFTLYDDSYEWEFVHEPGKSFTDSGSGMCVGDGPVADFTWTEDPDLTLAFSDHSSDPNGTVDAWSWNFGDGSPASTLQNPTHTFATAGMYTVRLTVTDNDGITGSTTRSVPAGPQAPVADFTWAATELTAVFSDASTDIDGTVVTWSWNFGDSGTSAEQSPTHAYAAEGEYTVTLTVTDNDGTTDTSSQAIYVSEAPAPSAGDVVYVTSSNAGIAAGIAFDDEDILAYDAGTGTWSIYFDGSDVGLTNSDQDTRSFALLPNGDILLNVKNPTTVPDVGAVEPSDIVRFTPLSTGANTSGTFSLYLRGADVGLAGEDIDAIDFAPDGRLVISTTGSYSVPGASGSDEDLIALDPGGSSWSLYFDGSDVGLSETSDEDVAGVWIDDLNGDIYLSTKGAFSVPDASGDSSAIFVCRPDALGDVTSCTYTPYWVGSASGLTANDVIGIHVSRSTVPVNSPPSAGFTYSCSGVDCDFTDMSSDPDGTVTGWSWNFGDGGTSSEQEPQHSYMAGGTYDVTLTVTDDGGATSTPVTQPVTITASNQPPLAVADAETVAEGGTLNVSAPGVLVNDSDPENDPLTVNTTPVTPPANGSLALNADGSYTYIHDGSETTSDGFVYEVSDGNGGTATASVNITVNPVNDPPVAIGDLGSVAEGGTLNVSAPGVLENDSDPENDPLTVNTTPVSGPANGSLTLGADGSYTYVHAGTQTTSDAFEYEISDGNGGTATATVNITITPVNDPPLAVDDDLGSVAEGATLNNLNVLSNDSDPDGTLDVTSVTIVGSSNGTATANPDGTVNFTHDGSETSSASFTYTVDDDLGATSNVATASLSVTPVNDPPVAVNDDFTGTPVLFGGTLSNLNVLSNDSDADGTLDESSVTIVGATNGTATVNPDGTVNFTHDGSPGSTASFTYTVNDDSGATSNVATASLAVAGIVRVTTPAGTDGYSTTGGRNSDRHLEVTVTLVDGTGAPVAGASVTATIDGPTPGGGTATTDSSGQVTFRITNAGSGTYTTTVNDVTAAGLTWDGTTPNNSYDKP